MKTTIINLYGAPGAGKSTASAYLFYYLKSQNKNVELVREYVKNYVWEGRKIDAYDQLYFLGRQAKKESLLYNKVDYIITDAPILMNYFYADLYSPALLREGIKSATWAFFQQSLQDGHQHYHLLIENTRPFNAFGRFQTPQEANQIGLQIRQTLDQLKINYLSSSGETVKLRDFISLI